ncbi:Integral membrane protein DUF92 [Seminavis robusta]|uniref:Integral membrane protein DUF92 n=1 Tax=Seminavis robusta TaxID=568900 RepID=A0A9N8H1X6_9STRA|nr:Integral membrane protein DUF92 [Seminavis robusta]|eukprot:Sro25_g016990.1 Integral membrane protein DUF92 (356) ;mRNA; f:90094-91283
MKGSELPETMAIRRNHSFILLLTLFLAAICQSNAFVVPTQPMSVGRRPVGIGADPSMRITPKQPLYPLSQLRKHSTTIHKRSRHNQQLHLALQEPVIQYLTSMFRCTGGVPFAQAFTINAVGISILQKPLSKMLTGAGLLNALILGTSLWQTLGWKGWSVCVAYLFLGVLVTKIRFSEKEKMGIAESRGGKRGPENLWGSAATGLACAICSRRGSSFLGIPSNLYILAYVASLATKLADTFASEIGKAFGKTTFLITTFQRVEPGTEGAVSAEGTAAAALGGFILSAYGWSLGMISAKGVAISTAAAFLATNAESLLGAILQDKEGLEWITNEVINFLNTLIGGGLAILGGKLFL